MRVRKAEFGDLNVIINIFKNSIDAMNDNGIHQWDELYLTNAILEQDIFKKQMYVGIKDDTIVSVVVVNNEFDKQFKNGNWEYGFQKFAVVHRLCVDPIYQNQKFGKNTMIIIEDFLQKYGIYSIRLDAFSQSQHALKMCKTLGYKKIGEAPKKNELFYLLEKELSFRALLRV